jgi:hypothetical protein
VIVTALLLVALWPKGWLLTEVTWTDPATKGAVSSRSLLIAHPWWMKGWYPPIGSTSQTGGSAFAPPGDGSLTLTFKGTRCDSIWLWRKKVVGSGSQGISRLTFDTPPTPAEWTAVVRANTRTAADNCGGDSAPMGGLMIRYHPLDWEVPRP